MQQFNNAFTIFLSLLVEALPFLLLGVVFSSALLLFVNERQLVKRLPRNPVLGALAGSSIGFLFPVCECGNVPVARRLLLQGVSPSVAIGFLLAAPTINPIVIWSTWIAFRDRPEMVFWRVGASLIVATIIAVVFSVQRDMRPLLQQNLLRAMPRSRPEAKTSPETPSLLKSGTYFLGQSGMNLETAAFEISPQSPLGLSPNLAIPAGVAACSSNRERWSLFVENALQELRELGGVLVIGSAIAAIVQVAIPREIVLSLGQGPISSIVAMLVLATLVSICSTVDAFFALSFSSAFTNGSLLAFLVFGPMIDLKAIGLMFSIFRSRAVIYLFVLAAQLSFIIALLINLHWS